MPSAFQTLQNTVFEQAKSLFGYPCSWTSVDGVATWSGRVLFKNPTERLDVGTFQYDPFRYEMEYKNGDFPGLYERVEGRGNPPEQVEIDGVKYEVRDITAHFDGQTFKATLQPVTDI